MTKPDKRLRELSEQTGGGYFELTRTADLNSTFTRVADELHRQYVIGFAPEKLDGLLHKLEVRVKVPGMDVRSRKSYLATDTTSGRSAAGAGSARRPLSRRQQYSADKLMGGTLLTRSRRDGRDAGSRPRRFSPAPQDPPQQPPVFRGTTETVAVYATVIDRYGEMLRNLERDDFIVEDDGRKQELTVFVKGFAAHHSHGARGHERQHDAEPGSGTDRRRAAGDSHDARRSGARRQPE